MDRGSEVDLDHLRRAFRPPSPISGPHLDLSSVAFGSCVNLASIDETQVRMELGELNQQGKR